MNKLKVDIEFKSLKNFSTCAKQTTQSLVIGVFKKEKKLAFCDKVRALPELNSILDKISETQFDAKFLSHIPLLCQGKSKELPYDNILVVGLGEKKHFTPQNALKLGGSISELCRKYKLQNIDVFIDSLNHAPTSIKSPDSPKDFAGRAPLSGLMSAEEHCEKLALGILLGSYTFDNYKSKEKDDDKILQYSLVSKILEAKTGMATIERALTLNHGVSITRDLQTLPSNDLYPSLLAQEAQKVAKTCGLNVVVFDEKKLKSENMNGILAVGQGSSNPPRFVQMEYNLSKKNLPLVIFVGKGITFDTGGTSLKPAPGMEEMKMDMSGAASVIGAMYCIAKLKAPIRAMGFIASAENRISHTSINPGDIYKAHNGKTVEVINTDAEGRLVLGDALSFAKQYNPSCVVDIATLTGAVGIALGSPASGIMGNNHAYTRAYQTASDKAGEKTWELPLYEEYAEDMKSTIADYRNIGSGREAGASKGGIFLNFFVEDAYPWIHLDVASTADTPKGQGPHCPAHVGTGVPVRGLVEFAMNYSDYVKSK
ncbi:MAG: leucyl aminopeptidase [Proteobacteria bacterium]|nr:leucyl aminopeptidase [Pseudomonadota bacterium]